MEGDEFSPEWSPDGERVAFAANTPGHPAELFVVDANGANLRQLTHTSACEDTPTWSRDGRELVAVSNVHCDDKEESSSLVRLHADGSGSPQLIVSAPAVWPDWSPDGRHLVYVTLDVASSDSRIVVSDPDGTNAEPLKLAGIKSPTEPAWAPDSQQIAFVSPTGSYHHQNAFDWNEDVYVAGKDGTNVQRVTTTAGNDHWPPAWSPDGKVLVYSSDGAETEQSDLMAIRLDNRSVSPLTDTATDDLLADWRP